MLVSRRGFNETVPMNKFVSTLIIAALALPAAAPAAPPLMTPDQAQRVRCVAALAIVSSDQQRGVGTWTNVPPLATRGAHFAATVGEALTAQGGRTREDVRAAILASVADFQKRGDAALTPQVVSDCVDLMNRIDPPPPPPGLTQCAALVALAAKEARAKDGLSATAKTLATFAAVLDNRAREQLRIQGKSESENDVIIGLAKEEIMAQTRSNPREAAGPDLSACLELAKP